MSANGTPPTPRDHVVPEGGNGSALTCTVHGTARGVARVSVAGEVDLATAGELQAALRRAGANADLVVLDLAALDFLDASGTRVILAAHRRARQSGGRLAVVGCPAHVERLFELIGVERELDMLGQAPARAASVRTFEQIPA